MCWRIIPCDYPAETRCVISPLHVPATTVALAVDQDGPLCGLALLGASGAGKSQLALELISHCAFHRTRLIADDISLIWTENQYLMACSPTPLLGKIELRGTGIATIPHLKQYRIRLAFRLGLPEARLPEPGLVWQPLGKDAPALAEYRWPAGRQGLVAFARALLSGHSCQAGFDSIPEDSNEDKSG